MSQSAANAAALPPVVFEDALGTRFEAVSPDGEPVEVFELKAQVVNAPSFEYALRKRVNTLTSFKDPSFAAARGVRLGGGLAVVSDRVRGIRLSTVLETLEQRSIPLELNAAICILRQLVPAVAILHETMTELCHGAIAPERLVITPQGRVVVAEHVLASALEALHYSDQQYWEEFRIAVPKTVGPTCFDQRSDVVQIGLVALALIHGRSLNHEAYPVATSSLLERASGVTQAGTLEPLPATFRAWLARALQLEPKMAFASAPGAWSELKRVLAPSNQVAELQALQSALSRCGVDTTETVMLAPPGTPRTPAPSLAAAMLPVPRPPVPMRESSPAGSTSGAPTTIIRSIQASPNVQAAALEAVPPPAPAAAIRRPVPAPASVAAPRIDMTTLVIPRIEAPPAAQPDLQSSPDEFASEGSASDVAITEGWWRQRWVAAAVVLVCFAGAGVVAGRSYLMPEASAAVPGQLIVETDPAGVPVVVDGTRRGSTPVTLELAAGSHVLTLLPDGSSRTIPLTIVAGSTVSQFVELPRPVTQTAQLQIRTEPSGATVSVDGTPRGTSPVTVPDLAAGTHRVEMTNDLGSIQQEITLEAGQTASLVVPMAAAPQGVPISGWISIVAPVDVQVYEDTRLVGSSRSDRLMVSVGRHELDIVNEALGYRAQRMVTVMPGQVSSIRLDWPNGSMAINAQPWAEVFIDGQRIGETPIGNVPVPIGTHEVVFRHPELGEQAVHATVTMAGPARLSVDLRKK